MDKEGFAIVSTFQRLEYLLWGGVKIYCDHRNMAYIFSPGALVEKLSKATAQRLLHWRTYLGQFDYQIVHIPSSGNC